MPSFRGPQKGPLPVRGGALPMDGRARAEAPAQAASTSRFPSSSRCCLSPSSQPFPEANQRAVCQAVMSAGKAASMDRPVSGALRGLFEPACRPSGRALRGLSADRIPAMASSHAGLRMLPSIPHHRQRPGAGPIGVTPDSAPPEPAGGFGTSAPARAAIAAGRQGASCRRSNRPSGRAA